MYQTRDLFYYGLPFNQPLFWYEFLSAYAEVQLPACTHINVKEWALKADYMVPFTAYIYYKGIDAPELIMGIY